MPRLLENSTLTKERGRAQSVMPSQPLGWRAALLLLACFSLPALGADYGLGDGHYGRLEVESGITINRYAVLRLPAEAGAKSLTVGTTDGFRIHDLILVLQTTGMDAQRTPSGTNTQFALDSSEGAYEFTRLLELTPATMKIADPLLNSYQANVTQVIKVPEYTYVTVNRNGAILADPWNGESGGVVAFLATGRVTNDGLISATGKGFRPGVAPDRDAIGSCSGVDEGLPGGGEKGEGMVVVRYKQNLYGYGRGNYANGAGAGVCQASGGGGGGHGGTGGNGGKSAEIDGARDVGGKGGAPLLYSLDQRLTLGGGGGSGQGVFGTTGPFSSGGAGGGAVVIRACQLTGGGILAADGNPGLGFASGNTVSAGGGGAGGAIVVRLAGDAGVGCTILRANGGSGGGISLQAGQTAVGPGGGGGGGRIFLQGADLSRCPVATLGGVAGTLSNGSGYGATSGSGATDPDAGTIELQAVPFDPGAAGCHLDPAVGPKLTVGCACASAPGLMVFAIAAVAAITAFSRRPNRRF